MEKSWIVDGYNLLHSGDRCSSQKQSREDLLTKLANFASVEMSRVTVVLDGKGPQSELDKYHTSFFEAVYSQEIPADAFIEKLASKSPSKLATTVVTSDRAIQNMAFGSGVCVVSSSEFSQTLKEFDKNLNDTLFKKKFESHGFNRPFEKKF